MLMSPLSSVLRKQGNTTTHNMRKVLDHCGGMGLRRILDFMVEGASKENFDFCCVSPWLFYTLDSNLVVWGVKSPTTTTIKRLAKYMHPRLKTESSRLEGHKAIAIII